LWWSESPSLTINKNIVTQVFLKVKNFFARLKSRKCSQ
jgi:hypothetical protein